MSNKVKLINRNDLVDKGVGVITETEEDISLEGFLLTRDIKECLKTIIEADIEHKRIEHTRKIEEGMKKKGVKRGRLPLSVEIQEEILRLREQGLTYKEIKTQLEYENINVCIKTINKYCKQKGVKQDEDKK